MEIPTTSKQVELVMKTISHKTDFPNMLKSQTPFSMENEIAKLKISIPLTELVNKNTYRCKFLKAINVGENTDTMNLNDDQPKLLFGPEVDGKPQEGDVPPFYVSLNIHDKILHNAILDSGASHTLMPKTLMEKTQTGS